MTEQELKKEQFIAKAMENKEKFAIHKRLIEEKLCIGGKMYIEDLKVFAERQVVDNQLLLNLMEYAESFAKEYHNLKIEKLKKVNDYLTKKDCSINIRSSDFWVECNVCKAQLKNWVGSTPCCGSIAYVVGNEKPPLK